MTEDSLWNAKFREHTLKIRDSSGRLFICEKQNIIHSSWFVDEIYLASMSLVWQSFKYSGDSISGTTASLSGM